MSNLLKRLFGRTPKYAGPELLVMFIRNMLWGRDAKVVITGMDITLTTGAHTQMVSLDNIPDNAIEDDAYMQKVYDVVKAACGALEEA